MLLSSDDDRTNALIARKRLRCDDDTPPVRAIQRRHARGQRAKLSTDRQARERGACRLGYFPFELKPGVVGELVVSVALEFFAATDTPNPLAVAAL